MAENIVNYDDLNGNDDEGKSIKIGLSERKEIRELQTQFLEFIKRINKSEKNTALSLQDLHHKTETLSNDVEQVKSTYHCTKEKELTELTIALKNIANLNIAEQINRIENKLIESQAKLKTLFSIATSLIALAAIVVPLLFK